MFLAVDPSNFLRTFVPQASLDARQPKNPFHDMREPPTTETEMRHEYSTRLKTAFPDTEFTFLTCDPNNAGNSSASAESPPPWFRVDLPLMSQSTNQDPFDDNLPTGAPRERKRKEAFDQVFAQVEDILHLQHRTFLFMVVFVGLSARLVRFDRSSVFVTTRFDIAGSDFLVDFLVRYTHLFREDRGYDITARYIDPTARSPRSLAEKMRRYVQDAKARKEEDYIIQMWSASLDEQWPWWKLRVWDELAGRFRWFVVGKPLSQAPGVFGRGTRGHIAVELVDDKLKKKFVYLKDTWRTVADPLDEASSIRKEGATLHDLNIAKTSNVPTLVCHGDLSGQHTRAPTTWAETLPGFKHPSQTYQHYRIVVKEVGKPLSELENSGDLVVALYDCIEAHRNAMKIGIIHRDISPGSIILYDKADRWHGLLTNWELATDPRVAVLPDTPPGGIENKRFASVSILDGLMTTSIATEMESFFHVLIYCGVRFLKHNIPDEFVGSFLHNYFHISSSCEQTGQLAASALKRNSLVSGTISLLGFGSGDYLRFIMWGLGTNETATPDYDHPLNDLIGALLSCLCARYTLDDIPASLCAHAAPSPRPHVHDCFESRERKEFSSLAHLSPDYLRTLCGYSANLDHHLHVMKLIMLVAASKPFPWFDRVDDKQPVCEFCLADSWTP